MKVRNLSIIGTFKATTLHKCEILFSKGFCTRLEILSSSSKLQRLWGDGSVDFFHEYLSTEFNLYVRDITFSQIYKHVPSDNLVV